MGKFDGIILLSDLDGTLALDGFISEENRKAIEYFKQNGGLFTYATGRMPDFVSRISALANAPIVAINGTLIYDAKSGKNIKEYIMPKNSLAVVRYVVQNTDLVRASLCSDVVDAFETPKSEDFDNFTKDLRKVVFVFKTEEEALFYKNKLNNKYKNYTFQRSWATGLEMRLECAGKGECLKELKRMTNSKIAIGAGDYENDLEMLKEADISYAPSDALSEVKKIVDKVGVSFKEHLIAYIIKDIEENVI